MKIFVSRKIPSTRINDFEMSSHEIVYSEFNRPLTAEEFLKKAKGSDAILSMLTDKIDGEVMDAIGPNLKIISNYAVGFDNISVKDATERGIVVVNTPCKEVDEAVAEHTWALLTALTRRIVESDEATRRGAYKGWEPNIFLGSSLSGKTLGIVGLGNIGKMVAKRAVGYGMSIIYNKRTRDEECEKSLGVSYSNLDDLLAKSDIVSLHVPLTEETRHMINTETLSKMKKGSYLVNTARGAVVSEHDLVESLRNGHLLGAALDVYDNEPNIDPELIGMPNVITTPHIASATVEAREKMGELAIGAVLKVLNNETPDNIVNSDVWPIRRK